MEILEKYARLLIDYSLDIKPGEKLLIKTTTIAEPLVKEIYKVALTYGAIVEIDFAFEGKNQLLFENSNSEQLKHIPILYEKAMHEFDAYLVIRAPYDLRNNQIVDPKKRAIRLKSLAKVNKIYSERTANKSLKRSLCQFPTAANAELAGMTLEEYQQFVYNACRLYDEDPKASWLKVRHTQQRLVDFLNKKSTIRYKTDRTDIQFSVKNRIWINSDGQANMPSGEVFTGPVEDSVQGVVHFDYPCIYMGQEAAGITLWVEDGKVVKWTAEKGQQLLDEVFKIKGAQYFGEVAIGTNYNIQRATKNILFDEKKGGTIHMAVGQSYFQTGGKNVSSVHWDMICNMKNNGEIYADGELIYKNGYFLPEIVTF